MLSPEQDKSKTKSDKAKDLYKSLEETAINKLTVKSTLLSIILPVSLLILRTLGYLLLLPPDQLELDVFIILSLLLILLVILFVLLYVFYEWKLRLDLIRQDLVDKNELTKLINKEFKKLNETVEDKAKETQLTNAIHTNAIIETQEHREETEDMLKTLDFSPNGVGNMDVNNAQKAINDLQKELDKQQKKNIEELLKQAEKDMDQDPIIDELEKEEITPEPKPDSDKSYDLYKASFDKPEPEEDPEPEPEILEDGRGNKYTDNADGTRNYL